MWFKDNENISTFTGAKKFEAKIYISVWASLPHDYKDYIPLKLEPGAKHPAAIYLEQIWSAQKDFHIQLESGECWI